MAESRGKVEVAVVEVAVMYPPTMRPLTESLAYGEEVPMPMLPLARVVPVPSSPVPKIRLPMLRRLSAVAVMLSMS